MVAMLLLNAQISLAWLRAPTKPSCIQSAPAEAPSRVNYPLMATRQSSRIVSVGSAAGVRCARFFLHLAEFLDAIRPDSFPNMRSLRQYNGRV